MEAMKIGLVKIAEKSIEIDGDATKEGPSQRHEVVEGGQLRLFFWFLACLFNQTCSSQQ